MTPWTKLSIEERLTILTNIAEEKCIVENAIEKDYWVSMVLRSIFTLPYADALVFKGGTSLSKGWNLIERFSEDIDLAIDRKFLGFGEELNKSQRTKLRKESKKFICALLTCISIYDWICSIIKVCTDFVNSNSSSMNHWQPQPLYVGEKGISPTSVN